MKRIKPETFYFNHGENAVILLHSYTGTPNDMRLMARKLEDENYSVYAPMFAGHGTFDPKNILEKGNPEIWWQQVVDAIEFMKKEKKKTISIFGLSLGSIFATKALEEYGSDITCGGVFGSPLFNMDYSNVWQGFVQYSQKVKEHYEGQTDPKFIEFIKGNSKIALDGINAAIIEVINNLDEIQSPYFIGQGSKDEMVDANSAQKLKTVLNEKNKDVTFKWYEDATHVLTVNKAHRQLETDVIEFLNNNINKR